MWAAITPVILAGPIVKTTAMTHVMIAVANLMTTAMIALHKGQIDILADKDRSLDKNHIQITY